MAKKKKVARRGVPTPEEIHACREEKTLPPVMLISVSMDQIDEIDEYDDPSEFWTDQTCPRGFFNTEEEAIEHAKMLVKNGRYEDAEFKVLTLSKQIKAIRPTVQVEVY